MGEISDRAIRDRRRALATSIYESVYDLPVRDENIEAIDAVLQEAGIVIPTGTPASQAAFYQELAAEIWEEEIPVSAAILASKVVDARIHGTLLHTLDVKTEEVERLKELLTLRERQMGLAAKFIGRYYELMRTPASPVNEVIDARQMVYAIGADLKNILEGE